jgi:NAD+ synthase (glutamine-hydrolysing)
MNSNGVVAKQSSFFNEELLVADLINGKFSKGEVQSGSKIPLIHDALVIGIKDYFKKLGFKKAIVGLSGGIDSAVTFALAGRALGYDNIYGVLMPSEYSSNHSIDDAKQLSENLGAPYEIVSIEEVYSVYNQKLKPLFKDLPFGLAEENLQARTRGVLLMAISNKFGHIVLNTSNKSEAAVGYGTLYGDMCGGLSVLGDVYKTEVFELARYINKESEVIPENSIIKSPSAELRPDQKDSDSLPDYDILDKVLFEYIENRKGPKELVQMGLDESLVNRVLRMVNSSEYKRYQTPPILRVSHKAFGMGRRMPIVAKYLL